MVHFCRTHPSPVVYPLSLNIFAFQGAVIHAKVQNIVLVFVLDEHGKLRNAHLNTETFVDLPHKRVFVGLSVFDAAASKTERPTKTRLCGRSTNVSVFK